MLQKIAAQAANSPLLSAGTLIRSQGHSQADSRACIAAATASGGPATVPAPQVQPVPNAAGYVAGSWQPKPRVHRRYQQLQRHVPGPVPPVSCQASATGGQAAAAAPVPLATAQSLLGEPAARLQPISGFDQVQLQGAFAECTWEEHLPLAHSASTNGAGHRHGQQRNRQQITPALITSYIKKARTWQQLQAVLERHWPGLNHIHASAALVHAAQLRQQQDDRQQQHNEEQEEQIPEPLLQSMLALVMHHVPSFQARQAANCLWAIAQLLPPQHPQSLTAPHAGHQSSQHNGRQLAGHAQIPAEDTGSTAGNIDAVALFQHLSSHLQLQLPHAQPQELANALWAHASVGIMPSPAWVQAWLQECHLHRSWQGFNARELANVLWALGKLAQAGALQAEVRCILSLLAEHQQHLAISSPQELSNSVWGVAQLCEALQSNDSLLHSNQQDGRQGSEGSRSSMSQELSGPAQQGLQPSLLCHVQQGTWMQQLLWCIHQSAQSFTAAECACALTCLGQLQVLRGDQDHKQAARSTTLALFKSLSRHSTARTMSARSAAEALHAAAVLGLPRSPAINQWASLQLAAVLAGVHQQGSSSRGSAAKDMPMALHALARLHVTLPQSLLTPTVAATLMAVEAGSASTLATILWSAAKLRLPLPRSFFAAFQRASYAAHKQLRPSQVAAIFWALDTCRVRPGRKWLQDVLGRVWRSAGQYSTGELVEVLVRLRYMQYSPGQGDEWGTWLVSELQPRFTDRVVPVRDCISLLCALAHLAPTCSPVVQWAAEVLVGEQLVPRVHTLDAGQLSYLVWACGCLGRTSPKQQQEPLSPMAAGEPGSRALFQSAPPSGPAQAAAAEDPGAHLSQFWELEAAPVDEELLLPSEQALDAAPSPAPDDDSATAGSLRSAAGAHQEQAVQVTPTGLRLGRGLGGEIMTACVRQDPASYAPHHISMLLYGLAALGLRPPRSWLTQLLYADGPQQVAARSSQDLALVVYCLGVMRVRPPAAWLGMVLGEILRRAATLNSRMVCGVLRGLSGLNYSPGAAWLTHFAHSAAPALSRMPPKQLARSYSAVVDLEPRLAEAWGTDFRELLLRQGGDKSGGGGAAAASSRGAGSSVLGGEPYDGLELPRRTLYAVAPHRAEAS